MHGQRNACRVKLPVFNGKGGIETLLHVLSRLLRAAKDDLDFYSAGDYQYPIIIRTFAKVLENEAYACYQDAIDSLETHDKECWERVLG